MGNVGHRVYSRNDVYGDFSNDVNLINMPHTQEQGLRDRFDLGEVPRKGVWFNYGEWSVLDCGELMKTSPEYESLKAVGLFMGWEAMKRENGKINADICHRAENWEKLKELL